MKDLVIDPQAVIVAQQGTLEQLLWFAWYTLRDNTPNKEHRFQERVARDLIEAATTIRIQLRTLGEWKESHCILILDELRYRYKMPWIEYDIYQQHFWYMLHVLERCGILDANPLNNWVYNNEARHVYNWQESL